MTRQTPITSRSTRTNGRWFALLNDLCAGCPPGTRDTIRRNLQTRWGATNGSLLELNPTRITEMSSALAALLQPNDPEGAF